MKTVENGALKWTNSRFNLIKTLLRCELFEESRNAINRIERKNTHNHLCVYKKILSSQQESNFQINDKIIKKNTLKYFINERSVC